MHSISDNMGPLCGQFLSRVVRRLIVPFVTIGLALPAYADAAGTTKQLSTATAHDQQSQPTISGTNVVWTNADTPPGSTNTNFDIFLFNLGGTSALNLTNTPNQNEFLEEIDGTNVVWTRAAAGVPGDIVVYNIATNTLTTIAGSTASVFFQQPSIHGDWVAFVRVGTQSDIWLHNLATGFDGPVTNDAAVQANPRVGDNIVVYEDYNSGNADIFGFTLPSGPAFPIATGADAQITPDIDGNTVVYVENIAGSDQIFAYDLVSKTTTQLTNSVSHKVLPRISGHRVVWSDDRAGNLDVYGYDFNTHTEEAVASGPGDQFLADIDGDNVVYTDNASGAEQVFLFTFSTIKNITVGIDIEPHRFPNVIHLGSRGTIPVAILSSATFDALADVDKSSLAFGRTGKENSLAFCEPKGRDVNGDGRPDLICRFKTQLTGFQPGDKVGVLTGKDINGNLLTGSDSVKVVKRHDDDDDDDHDRHHEHGWHDLK